MSSRFPETNKFVKGLPLVDPVAVPSQCDCRLSTWTYITRTAGTDLFSHKNKPASSGKAAKTPGPRKPKIVPEQEISAQASCPDRDTRPEPPRWRGTGPTT